MKRLITLLCCIVAISLIAQVDAQQAKKSLQVAVYPFDAVGVKSNVALVITNAVARELKKSKKLRIRDQQSTRAAIEQIGLAQSGHCTEDTCRVEAGKILKAQKLVMGSIEKLKENFYTVSMRVVDVQTADTEYEVARDCPCSDIVEVRNMATKLAHETILVYLETGKKPEAAAAPPPVPAPPSPPRAAGPAPPTVSPAGKGALVITTSPPGADIYLDAAPMGKTPKTLANIPAGTHRLTLVMGGYTTLNKGVEVHAGRKATIREILVRQTGSINISSTPPGAGIWIDAKYIGKTPKKMPGMPVGKHKIKISLRDYRDYAGEVTVEANETAEVKQTLKGLPGRILVTSTPGGADVFIDRKKVGATPYSGQLSSGSHSVRVSKQGYRSAEEIVTIQPNKPRTLDVTLKKGPDYGEMVHVPAGEFRMGCNKKVDKQCSKDEKPYHKVHLDAFYIDKYEVTVEQYAACVRAGKCKKPNAGGTCNWGKSDRGNHPINCVDWYQAKSYCEWTGRRLPTEAEWEKAARGTDGRKYPWGNQKATCDYAVMNENNQSGCGRGSTWPVGGKPRGASPYGAMDMAGNVWEWCADWYDEKYYRNSPNRNPKGPSSGKARVLRGGSWNGSPNGLRSSPRGRRDPDFRHDNLGFRCARTL